MPPSTYKCVVVYGLSVGCLWGYLCGCVLHVLIHVYMYVNVCDKSVLPCSEKDYYLLNTHIHIENNQPTDSYKNLHWSASRQFDHSLDILKTFYDKFYFFVYSDVIYLQVHVFA